jgi:hypothetical protein
MTIYKQLFNFKNWPLKGRGGVLPHIAMVMADSAKYWSHLVVTVSPGIEPGYIVFPSHKNNVYV